MNRSIVSIHFQFIYKFTKKNKRWLQKVNKNKMLTSFWLLAKSLTYILVCSISWSNQVCINAFLVQFIHSNKFKCTWINTLVGYLWFCRANCKMLSSDWKASKGRIIKMYNLIKSESTNTKRDCIILIFKQNESNVIPKRQLSGVFASTRTNLHQFSHYYFFLSQNQFCFRRYIDYH